jgi:hypothetical protein
MNCSLSLVVVVILIVILIYYSMKLGQESFPIVGVSIPNNPLMYVQDPTTIYPYSTINQVGLKIAAGPDVFQRIQRTKLEFPTIDEITLAFDQCIASGDTVKGCLTKSAAGYQPLECKRLCIRYYGELSPYCTSVCNNMMTQQRTSCASGPC